MTTPRSLNRWTCSVCLTHSPRTYTDEHGAWHAAALHVVQVHCLDTPAPAMDMRAMSVVPYTDPTTQQPQEPGPADPLPAEIDTACFLLSCPQDAPHRRRAVADAEIRLGHRFALLHERLATGV
jgi:hypothetical protein